MGHRTRSRAHVVVLGAGFGGLRCVQALRKVPVNVTLLDRRNYHLFQPLLYQVATAALSPADIAVPIRRVFRRQGNTKVLMGEVTGISKERSIVFTNAPVSQVPFDYLVIATGSQHSYFGHDDWIRHAPGLKSLEDAVEIRAKVLLAFELAEQEDDPGIRDQLLTFAIIGGGATGVELAGAIAELARRALVRDFRHINPASARIILLEAGPRILAPFPQALAERASGHLRKFGVQLRLNAKIRALDEDGITLDDGRIATRTVIWAAGVQASDAARWLQAEHDNRGRIFVERDLTLSGFPRIYVIGDTAHAPGSDGKPLPGVAPVAMQQGRYVAEQIARRVRGAQASPPFRYRNKGNLATIGRSAAVADLGRVRFDGALGWLAWALVHIAYLISFRNRLLVLAQWAYNYVTFERGARLITEQTPAQDRQRTGARDLPAA